MASPSAKPSVGLRVALVGTGAIEIPPPAYGAVEEYIAHLASELTRLGHQVEVVNEVLPFRSSRVREVLFASSLERRLPNGRFDIIHAHSALTAEALRTLGRPYVFTSHSRYWLSESKGLQRIWKAREAMAVRAAEGVIALSPRVIDRFRVLRRATPSDERVVLIPFGVDVDRFRPPSDGRERRGLIGLGTVARHKRFDILAAAAREVGTDATVVGPASDTGLATELLEINPRLVLTGEIAAEELPERLSGAKVFVHPSDQELASVATVQAMASGLPVVGSDLLEGIVTHGVDGFLVPRRDPFERRVATTAGFVRELLDDPSLWQRMSEAARAAAVGQHAWPRVAEEVSRFYGRIAGRDAPSAGPSSATGSAPRPGA